MLNQVQGLDYAYTSKGNVYKKSIPSMKIIDVVPKDMTKKGLGKDSMIGKFVQKLPRGVKPALSIAVLAGLGALIVQKFLQK